MQSTPPAAFAELAEGELLRAARRNVTLRASVLCTRGQPAAVGRSEVTSGADAFARRRLAASERERALSAAMDAAAEAMATETALLPLAGERYSSSCSQWRWW
jgi:hypothetical protein